jgi:LuxR family maltose regulon positive regulatory protein
MSTPILATKLYIPPPRPKVVLRPRLVERMNEGLAAGRKLTLISASAGFGKTTLVSEWLAGPWHRLPHRPDVLPGGQVGERPAAWLSLDEGDNDPTRFLTYLVAALQTLALPHGDATRSEVEGIAANIGAGVLAVLQSPQPPPTESILTALLNEIATVPSDFVLVLDDYHVIEAQPVDHALSFLIEHLPPCMHLVIATREDPHLPLARLRVRGQLTELRAADLRFTPAEAAEFLNQVMGLNLSAEDIAALETRTEGWIAGLQLAALSMQGHQDTTGFITSFTGSHRFVLDYLVEEVLQQQSASVQTFLLRTSILDRLCGPLCDAVLLDSSASGQETLEYLEHANLFIVPLDDERRWYRYHHLFADLLRQRLYQSAASSREDEGRGVAEYHIRASQWYEDNGLELEAFHHAVAANDVERAARLVEGKGMPLHFRGAVVPVLHWLASLPATVLDAWPSLWTTYASVILVSGQQTGVEEKLQAAEAALQKGAGQVLQGAEPVPRSPRRGSAVERPDDNTRDTIGRIAAIRATLAATLNQVETVIAQSRRALEYLHPDNLSFRTFTIWKLGYAYHLQGDRAAASRAYTEAISISQASGNIITTIVATIGLGAIQEADNQLYLAAETYRRVLQLFGDQPLPVACEAHLGLARIAYEWNDLDAAHQHGQQSVQLARQSENTGRVVACEVFLAHLKLAQGDGAGAAAMLAKADQAARQHNFVLQMPEVVAAQVLTLLHQGNLAAAAHLAQTHELPISQARVHLALGDTSAALAVLEPLRQQMKARGWQDKQLKVTVLQAVALHAHGEQAKAVQLLGDALALAEPGGFIRIFVDEGAPMAQLLSEAAARGIMPDYIAKLLAAFEAERQAGEGKPYLPPAPSAQPLIEPLSQRELEILQLIAQGFSNREIGERLFLALDTVKGHARRIYGKLQVQRRTEAIARARELDLL